ncbi:KISc [Musa troglodytarum]|uniref:KISc n=1 Tax=Musa troglodytarum TaxID=320322 RepID=A0A9E7H3W1_9LILI|nr:KISc [Musa troglodytarum]
MEDGRRTKEEPCRVSFRDGRLASRKAEEAALRRSEAASWLESIVGPLGLPPQPTEKEFVSCLTSGIVLCNAINRIQPGAVPKVVARQSVGTAWDIQPLPAYQYFENVRNFLVAVEDLKLPSFEASDLERDTVEASSAVKIVDCILALKNFHELQQSNGENGPWQHVKSPMVPRSFGQLRSLVFSSGSVNATLDMSATAEKPQLVKNIDQCKQVDSLVSMLSDLMFNSKENIDQSLIDSWNKGKTDHVKLFSKIMSSCLEGQQESVLQDLLLKGNVIDTCSTKETYKCCSFCLREGDCDHWYKLEAQEKELMELKALLSETREQFITLQTQLQNDFTELGIQIHEFSVGASRYHQAIKENRHLYNILQELRGNIRVFCRIRPIFKFEAKSCIEYIGNDGSLMVFDPCKSQNTRKIFQFNKVFGPATTQGEVYKETQSLIRSVMDGYNVCIFAYGQTGAGKTYTMCGSSNGSYIISYFDLLINYSSTLEIMNCSGNGGLSIPNASIRGVQSTADVLNLMILGEKNRAFSSTAMNHRSSRSHSVLTIHVHGKDISGNTIRSCLHLVDLAGSERVDKSEVTGDQLKEAQHINKSLSCLGDVITALAQKNSHIPYRNSKLTQLLQNSLGGNAKMLMFIHPESDSHGETISTLKFAQRASTVELGAPHQNKESSEIRNLKEQIDNLKKALMIKEEKFVHPYKLKENTPVSERSKQMTDHTPLCPRRLSIENGSVPKAGTTANPDSKVLKSPVSRLKYTTDGTPTCNRRLSSEGLSCESNQKEHESSASHLCSNIGPEANASLNSENFVAGTKYFQQSSPITCNTHAQSRLPRIASSCTLDNDSLNQTRKLDETTPNKINSVTKLDTRDSNKGAISKGSHIRKSLQSLGRLINGSERRNNQCQTETVSSKFVRNTDINEKSPVTADARLRRRQSLTNLETLGSSVSRRSSLGGKSVDSGQSHLRHMLMFKEPPNCKDAATSPSIREGNNKEMVMNTGLKERVEFYHGIVSPWKQPPGLLLWRKMLSK